MGSSHQYSWHVYSNVRHALYIFSLSIFLLGCENKSYQTTEEKEIKFPDNKAGNYILLSDNSIKEYQLDDEQLKSFQYYLSDDLKIDLHYENESSPTNTISRMDTQLVTIKSIYIKKFTPCVLVKNIYSEKETRRKLDSLNKVILKNEKKYYEKFGNRKFSEKEYETILKSAINSGQGLAEEFTLPSIVIEEGYEIDFGNGITLIYDPRLKFFKEINKIDENLSKLKSSYKWSGFESNAGLLVDLSQPIIKYRNEDTLVLTGIRK